MQKGVITDTENEDMSNKHKDDSSRNEDFKVVN